jgi:hypothetical protein
MALKCRRLIVRVVTPGSLTRAALGCLRFASKPGGRGYFRTSFAGEEPRHYDEAQHLKHTGGSQ